MDVEGLFLPDLTLAEAGAVFESGMLDSCNGEFWEFARDLFVGRMQDQEVGEYERVGWALLAKQAIDKKYDQGDTDALSRETETARLRAYLIREFGPRDQAFRNPIALFRDSLSVIDRAPEEVITSSRSWRDMPREQMLHLRKIKNLINALEIIFPNLPSGGQEAISLQKWLDVRSSLP